MRTRATHGGFNQERGGRRRDGICVRPGGANLEDRLAYLGESPEIRDESELSFRLLRHYASSVRHSKYYGLDIVTVHVERSG